MIVNVCFAHPQLSDNFSSHLEDFKFVNPEDTPVISVAANPSVHGGWRAKCRCCCLLWREEGRVFDGGRGGWGRELGCSGGGEGRIRGVGG